MLTCVTCGGMFRRKPQTTGRYCSNTCANRGSAKKAPIADRFWSKVQQTDHCWMWTASKNNKGYGVLGDKPKRWLAHRLSWTLAHGDIPDTAQVLHRCDNPACVRPDHLFLGNPAINAADKISKGRHNSPRGEAKPNARLTYALVAAIRQDTRSYSVIASEYGVSKGAIKHAKTGRTWAK